VDDTVQQDWHGLRPMNLAADLTIRTIDVGLIRFTPTWLLTEDDRLTTTSPLSSIIPTSSMRRSLLRLAEHAAHGHAKGGVGSAPHVHPPKPWIYYSAVGLGASTTFFVLYMAKKEGPVLLVWPCHPPPDLVTWWLCCVWDSLGACGEWIADG